MEKIFKIFKAEIKSVDHAEHTIEVIVSTGSVDRHMESIDPNAFKKRLATYKAHPVLLSSHDYYDLRKQIGEAQSVKIKDEALVAKFKYYVGEGNEEADWAFNLASKKVAAFSVGFIGHAYEETEVTYEEAKEKNLPLRIYTDVELVEISQVLIPSNRDAVQEKRNALEQEKLKAEEARENGDAITVSIGFEEKLELCTKALDMKDLLPEKPKVADPGPVVPDSVVAAFTKAVNELNARLDAIKSIVDQMSREEILKAIREDDAFEKEIAAIVLGLLKSGDSEKKILKELLIDAVEEIAQDDFYRELLFGKVAQKSQQPTPQELSESLKQIARKA